MTDLADSNIPIFDFDEHEDLMIVLPHETGDVIAYFYPSREFCEMLIKELNTQPPSFELFASKIEDDLDRRKERGD